MALSCKEPYWLAVRSLGPLRGTSTSVLSLVGAGKTASRTAVSLWGTALALDSGDSTPISKLTLQPTNQPHSTSEPVALQTLHRTGADPAHAPQAAPHSASTRSQGRKSLCIWGPHCPSAENLQCCFRSHSTFHPRVGAWDAGLSSGAAAASLPVVPASSLQAWRLQFVCTGVRVCRCGVCGSACAPACVSASRGSQAGVSSAGVQGACVLVWSVVLALRGERESLLPRAAICAPLCIPQWEPRPWTPIF